LKKLVLNEDLFEDNELPAAELEEPIVVSTNVSRETNETVPGPTPGNDSGVADILMNLIKDELEAIQGYNDFLATIADKDEFDHMKETIEHINSEENKHIGELQALLKTISPNVEMISDGQEEAIEEMGE